ncbi:MAG: two-component sensor histidine kinase, partial [Caulobacteraceae bacterium]
MAAYDAAFAAAGGATFLALAATFWTLSQRRQAAARVRELTEALRVFERRAEAAHASTEAFDRAVVVLEANGVRLASGRDSLASCAIALGLPHDAEPEAVVDALVRSHPEHARRLQALSERGEPCDFEARGHGKGAVVVEGRTAGALAWLGLSTVSSAGLPSAARFAAFLDAQPDPAWITGLSGRLVWANRAWLDAAEAETVEDAVARGVMFDRNVEQLPAEAAAAGGRRESLRWA